MNLPPVLPDVAAAPPERVLRRLFLTLFLRGRGARGLRKEGAPKSVGSKLALTLLLYAAVGVLAVSFEGKPVFALSLYLHGMTLLAVGMYVGASSGEVLFNKEEADILLHRPITPRVLLWAKVRVLVEVSLWLGGAFNLVGMFVGVGAVDGGWLYPVAHAGSTVLEALFCTGSVVLVYQLCLRWFGRQRLEGLMTTAQVLLAVTVVVGGQVVPRVLARFGPELRLGLDSWWVGFLPPAWFAGFDDALAGGRASSSWGLGAVAIAATAGVLWLAFGRLAGDYGAGLQALTETVSPRRGPRAGRGWVEALMRLPGVRWWMRDSVARGAFKLTIAYMIRDRDVKLRLYPSLAPVMVMPFVFLLQGRGGGGMDAFGVAFAGGYLGMVPLLGLDLLQYSSQWQAADLFRSAPVPGPGSICHGARRAVLCFLALPALVVFALLAWAMRGASSQLPLLLPGIIALPIYAMVPCLGGHAVPFCQPVETAKSAGRGLKVFLVMILSAAISGLATWAWVKGWFWWLMLAETLLAIGLYWSMRASVSRARWPSME